MSFRFHELMESQIINISNHRQKGYAIYFLNYAIHEWWKINEGKFFYEEILARNLVAENCNKVL